MTNTPFKSDDIEKIVYNAKRKSILRSFIISTISLIVLGAIMIIVNAQIVNWAHHKAIEGNNLLYKISQPNVKKSFVKFDYGILSGSYTNQKYKLIMDRVVPWGEEHNTFNALGHNNPSASMVTTRVGENEEESKFYNPVNGQRTMLFFHPWFEYVTIQNDLSLIQETPDDAVMEVAVSFDQPYSVNEIQEFFPLSKEITWYWANGYNQNNKKQFKGLYDTGDTESHVYGFSATTEQWEGKEDQSEKDYLALLNKLKNSGNYDYIVDRLLDSANENQEEGLILGVVVTGTKEDLLKLEKENNIRAVSVGAVVRKF